MDEYLAEKGITAADVDITLMFNTSSGHQQIAEAIQQMWKTNLGLDIKVTNQEWKVFLETIRDPVATPQIYRLGWCVDYPDANNFIREVFIDGGSANIKGGGGISWGAGDPEYDAWAQLLLDAAKERDPSEAHRHVRAGRGNPGQHRCRDHPDLLVHLVRRDEAVCDPLLRSDGPQRVRDLGCEQVSSLYRPGGGRPPSPRAAHLRRRCPHLDAAPEPGCTQGSRSKGMGRYFVRRLLWMVLVLFVVSAITFGLMHAVPGGPFSREKAVPAGDPRESQRALPPR